VTKFTNFALNAVLVNSTWR